MVSYDLLFIEFDQKKIRKQFLNAYNNPKGITAVFNKMFLQE